MKKCVIIFAIAIVLSMFASPAHAFGRRGGGRCFSGGCYVSAPCHTPVYTPVHEKVVVVKEVVPVLAYPVLVPAFQFQYVPQAYAAATPVVPVAGYPVASPIIQPTIPTYGQPTVPNYGAYGQPAMPNYGQPQQNFGVSNKDKIRELARALLEEMSKMSEENNPDNGPPAVPNAFSQPVQPSQPSQQQLAQVAISSMARTCAQCHTGVGSKADMVLFTQPGLLNQNANWRKVKDEVASGRMPPKDVHFQLSLQERQYILQWLQSIGVN